MLSKHCFLFVRWMGLNFIDKLYIDESCNMSIKMTHTPTYTLNHIRSISHEFFFQEKKLIF